MFHPNIPPHPIATLNRYGTWDFSGKGTFVSSPEMAHTLNAGFRERFHAILEQPDGFSDGQDFRLQIADVPEVLSIVAAPTPASLSLTTAPGSLPSCGSGFSTEKINQKIGWKATDAYNLFDFVDFAGCVTLYQRASMGGVACVNGDVKGSWRWDWRC
jgi:hypothetical protein